MIAEENRKQLKGVLDYLILRGGSKRKKNRPICWCIADTVKEPADEGEEVNVWDVFYCKGMGRYPVGKTNDEKSVIESLVSEYGIGPETFENCRGIMDIVFKANEYMDYKKRKDLGSYFMTSMHMVGLSCDDFTILYYKECQKLVDNIYFDFEGDCTDYIAKNSEKYVNPKPFSLTAYKCRQLLRGAGEIKESGKDKQ